jgi:general secretion pathway protein F
MTQYSYRAKEGLQKIVDGHVDAETQEAAVAKILHMGFVPLEVWTGTRGAFSPPRVKKDGRLNFFRVSRTTEVTVFTRLAADLVDAGLPVFKVLRVIERQTPSSRLKDVVTALCTQVQSGASFSTALTKHPDFFSSMYVNMVRAGEASGNLNEVLESLADLMEKDQAIRSNVQLSLIYPSLILLVGSLTIFVVMTWVIPRITVVFEDLGTDLPLVTQILMSVSGFLGQYWWAVILGVGVFVLCLGKFIHTPVGKVIIDRFILKVPLLGGLQRHAQLGRFARTTGTLLDNGVVVVAALQAATEVVDNSVIRADTKKIEAAGVNGESLTSAFKHSFLFPETAISMISVGDESGKAYKGLYKVAIFYERKTQHSIKIITSLIEPLLILLVGGAVGFVVMAMLLPIFRINELIR